MYSSVALSIFNDYTIITNIISGTFSSSKNETIHPLKMNSPYLNSLPLATPLSTLSIHKFDYTRYFIWVESYSNCSICVSFVSCNIITSSKLIHVVPRIRTSEFLFKECQNSFSRLTSIPFFVHTVFGLSIHVLVDLGSQISVFS